MNETISKIVGLLFQDLEESAETNALREEVLQNCQERYDDLLQSGRSEDEAAGAVVESLKGMEEVLASYPRKAAANPEPRTDEVPGELSFPALHGAELRLKDLDLRVLPSPDDTTRLRAGEMDERLEIRVENDVLFVERTNKSGDSRTKRQNFSIDGSHFHWEGEGMDLSDLVKGVVSLAQKGLASLGIGGSATLYVPARSGFSLRAESASGDLRLEDLKLSRLSLRSASGDLSLKNVSVQAPTALSSTSGDIDWNGSCPEIELSTISGDLCAKGDFPSGACKSVSGDVELKAKSDALGDWTLKSTSGDVRAELPDGARTRILCRSVSGDVRQQVESRADAQATLEVSTISGDVLVE